jgi:hypothetical protein
MEFTPQGQKNRTMFAEAISIAGATVLAHAVTIGPDGKPVPPPPPQPSDPQRWSEAANNDELLHDALTHFGKGANWYAIYNALECLMDRAGGQPEFLDLEWEPKSQVKRLKQTANWERHSKNWKQTHKRPKKPMHIKNARNLLGRLVRKALANVS